MLSHIFVGVADFQRALGFYAPILRELGHRQRFCDAGRPWAGWESDPGPRPLFVIAKPFDGGAPSPGNGTMVAFAAPTRAHVDRAYELALSLGGRSEGPPGLRPQYHPDYYGAYFRDPDGNKLCIACHGAE